MRFGIHLRCTNFYTLLDAVHPPRQGHELRCALGYTHPGIPQSLPLAGREDDRPARYMKKEVLYVNLLEVKSISKVYGESDTAVHALKKVSFSVPKGEFVAIVGESGSGKSTLLNMIGALDTPSFGKVYIGNKDIFAMKEKSLTVFRRRNIGFIFQSFNLIPELTVEQNIIFPVLLDYQKPNQGYLEELLAVLNLTERRHHLPGQLSGGQQQRVAIGRALITRPALILADETNRELRHAEQPGGHRTLKRGFKKI